jgi:hypothetical protein
VSATNRVTSKGFAGRYCSGDEEPVRSRILAARLDRVTPTPLPTFTAPPMFTSPRAALISIATTWRIQTKSRI